jgi:hypothetical protein
MTRGRAAQQRGAGWVFPAIARAWAAMSLAGRSMRGIAPPKPAVPAEPDAVDEHALAVLHRMRGLQEKVRALRRHRDP